MSQVPRNYDVTSTFTTVSHAINVPPTGFGERDANAMMRPRTAPAVHARSRVSGSQHYGAQFGVPAMQPSVYTATTRIARTDGPFQLSNTGANPSASPIHPSMRPQFRTKVVCDLQCGDCGVTVCRRGMRAILLADTNVELFSTDLPPQGVQMVNDDYFTRNCSCRIRDVACLGCGNIAGYHVTQPCETCMDSCNNGHFWMFHIDRVTFCDRVDSKGKTMLWCELPRSEDKLYDLPPDRVYEQSCR